MKKTIQMMAKKLKTLKKLLKKTEQALRLAPEGSLKIKMRNGHPEYYRREPGPNGKDVYISVDDEEQPRELAQKSYDQKVQRLLNKKVRAMAQFIKNYPTVDIDDIFEGLSPQRQALVTPVTSTKKQLIDKWLRLPYTTLGFHAENKTAYFTYTGLRVRSKAELLIANELDRLGIPYKYECALTLNGITIYPDFTIYDVYRNRIIYLEHCGMLGKDDYADDFVLKWNLYTANGIIEGERLILTYESNGQPLNTQTMRTILAYYLPEYYENEPAA